MKLLISLSYYYPHISGLTLSVKRLAELFSDLDYKVTILTTQHEKKLPQSDTVHNVTIIRVPYLFRISKGFFMPGFFWKAISAVRHVDAVLITLPQFEGLLVALLAKAMGKKIVCLYVCELQLTGGFTQRLIGFTIKMCNRATLFFADSIVTLSEDFARNNLTLTHQKKQVYGIYPIVTAPMVDKEERRRLKEKLPENKYYIGYLGRIASEKGLSYLFDAIPILKKTFGDKIVIVLAGPSRTVGEDDYRKMILRLMEKYSSSIVRLGELSDAQLGAYYSLLDVFVLPSINNTEAFGMVQVEAMFCGIPIVATDLPGVRVPVIKTGMGEIVRPADSISIAQAIITILHNRKKYIKEPSDIKKIFSIEVIANSYQKIFRV